MRKLLNRKTVIEQDWHYIGFMTAALGKRCDKADMSNSNHTKF